jgi:hypothetical protein
MRSEQNRSEHVRGITIVDVVTGQEAGNGQKQW